MIIDTKQILTMSEVNQNFSKAARAAAKSGSVIVFKNNKAKYLIIDLDQELSLNLSDDEKIDIIAKRVLNKYRYAFLELAK